MASASTLSSWQSIQFVWADFIAFLRRPRLLRPTGLQGSQAWQQFWAMAVLQVIVMALLIPILMVWQKVIGQQLEPLAFGKVPQAYLIPLTIIAAPFLEEIFFRGWLTGRPRALWLLLAGSASLPLPLFFKGQPALGLGLVLASWLILLSGWLLLSKKSHAPAWYNRNFAWVFYGAVICFGLPHVLNYDNPGLLTIPMVLPQLWCGLSLGFVRLRIGLVAAILMHALSNGIALSLALAGY